MTFEKTGPTCIGQEEFVAMLKKLLAVLGMAGYTVECGKENDLPDFRIIQDSNKRVIVETIPEERDDTFLWATFVWNTKAGCSIAEGLDKNEKECLLTIGSAIGRMAAEYTITDLEVHK